MLVTEELAATPCLVRHYGSFKADATALFQFATDADALLPIPAIPSALHLVPSGRRTRVHDSLWFAPRELDALKGGGRQSRGGSSAGNAFMVEKTE